MNVRVARTGESDTIAEVFIASFRGLTFLPTIHTDDQIRTWICDQMIPAHDVWVAEDAGSVVGFLSAISTFARKTNLAESGARCSTS